MNLTVAADALKEMAQALNITTKSVDEIVAEYDNMLTTNVRRGFRNQTTDRDLAAAHRDMIRALAPQVYFEGLRQGGVEQDEADDEDREAIRGWIDSQLPHVRGFAEAVMDAKRDKLSQEAVYARLDQWLRALRSLGDLARANAEKNTMGEWRLGATEQHCNGEGDLYGCQQLHGQRHRLKWYTSRRLIPQTPGQPTTCGGWQCLCTIVDTRGRVILPA